LALSTAVGIMGIFALMFTGIVVAVLWFTHSTTKMESQNELQKKKIDVINTHFTEMVRIECPYCSAIYASNQPECPNCGANTRKILFPDMPN
jgi:hypothetical protein